MAYVEVSTKIVKDITVDFSSVAAMDSAAIAIRGRENTREVSGACDAYLAGAIWFETRKLVADRTASDQAALMGRSDAYLSNAAAVADVAAVVAGGTTDVLVTLGRSEKHVAKVEFWAKNVREFWASENGPGSSVKLVEACEKLIGEDGAQRAEAIVALFGTFGNVDNFKRVAKGPKNDPTPGDDDNKVATAEQMLRNALAACQSAGIESLAILAIVKSVID